MESQIERLISSDTLSKKVEWCQRQIELLTCPLCYGIVTEPIECLQCDTLFCKYHAQKWMGEKGSCPSCKMKPWKLKPRIHKAYHTLMEKLKFDCPCGEMVGYTEMEKHGFWMHLQHQDRADRRQRGRNSKSRPENEDKTNEREENLATVRDPDKSDRLTLKRNKLSVREGIFENPPLPRVTSGATIERPLPQITSKFIFSYHYGDYWYLFDRSYNKKLNSALPRSKFAIGSGPEAKKFDLTGMVMSDEFMDYQLRAEPFVGYIWRCFIKQDKAYIGYSRDINIRMNEQYELNGGKGSMLIYSDKCDYLLDFDRMVQINQQTHYQRPISRNQY